MDPNLSRQQAISNLREQSKLLKQSLDKLEAEVSCSQIEDIVKLTRHLESTTEMINRIVTSLMLIDP